MSRELARGSYPPYPDVATLSGASLRVERRHNAAGGIEAINLCVHWRDGLDAVTIVELTGGEARTLAFQLGDAAERWRL